MRKSKFIRRRNFGILNALFLASALLFYETHTGIFLKEFAEHELEEFLPNGTAVTIGSMEGGIFKDLVSENVRILPQKDAPEINIERIEINYRLWYPLLRKLPAFSKINTGRKAILFIGKGEKDFLKGFLELKKEHSKLDVDGYLGVNKEKRVFIKGTIEEKGPWRFHITQKKGTIDLEIKKKEKLFLINAEINHISLQGADIIAEGRATIDAGGGDFIRAEISLKKIIIDYNPFEGNAELFLAYDRIRDVLNVTKFKVAEEIEGYGHFRFTPPSYVFLKWVVTNLDLEKFFLAGAQNWDVSGVINGNFTLKGPMKEPALLAHADMQNGNFGDVKFDSVIINLKGKWPIISIQDSRLRKEENYITLGGEADLSKLKEGKAFDGVILNMDDNFFVWDGWSVTKEREASSVKAEKFLDKEFNLSFKAHTEDKEEERFLGVEHKVKF